LLKPLASGGGAGIFEASGRLRDPARHFFQEFVDGEPHAGLFVAGPDGCRLLGVTRQLVGEKWLHAAPFRYAGSIGPCTLSLAETNAWQRLGDALTTFAGLRGLFGIDAIVRDGVPWPVEINPRYTASVEVVEYATGLRALALHRGETIRAGSVSDGPENPSLTLPARTIHIIGKAVWFAPRSIVFPTSGPWDEVLSQPPPHERPPTFADIPAVGERIAAGRPVITVFATADSAGECENKLRAAAAELDDLLLR
jgi:predicted ATP-grasp superfamily ATP-dependent carboligase